MPCSVNLFCCYYLCKQSTYPIDLLNTKCVQSYINFTCIIAERSINKNVLHGIIIQQYTTQLQCMVVSGFFLSVYNRWLLLPMNNSIISKIDPLPDKPIWKKNVDCSNPGILFMLWMILSSTDHFLLTFTVLLLLQKYTQMFF